MRYSRILENKSEEWQNKEEERLNHIVNQIETENSWEAMRHVVTKNGMQSETRNLGQLFSDTV